MIRDCEVSRGRHLLDHSSNGAVSGTSDVSPTKTLLGEPQDSIRRDDIDLLMRHIEATIDLTRAAKGPPSYWISLPLCVIDAVWSIQAKYETQVVPLIRRFCRSNTPKWEEETASKPTNDIGPTLREFCDVLEARLKSGYTFETLFSNCQRTSSRSGILKAEAVHRFAKALLASGINKFSDARDHTKVEQAEKKVKEIPGQGSGITFTYFLMLAGNDGYVKSDTHIRRFVSDALSIEWSRLVSEKRAGELVREAAMRFANDYPGLTPVGLDFAIWNYQHTRTSASPKAKPASPTHRA